MKRFGDVFHHVYAQSRWFKSRLPVHVRATEGVGPSHGARFGHSPPERRSPSTPSSDIHTN